MGAMLLVLADGRAPTGAYAHSFGLESAVDSGAVDDVASLVSFAAARARTAGLVEACVAGGVCVRLTGCSVPPGSGAHAAGEVGTLAVLAAADAAFAARVPSPALRASSAALGRHLLRAGERAWPASVVAAARRARPDGWFQPAALGLVATVAGLDARGAAVCMLHGLVAGIASAGVRLLGLDPLAVHAAQAGLAADVDALAGEAAALAPLAWDTLPAWSAPLADVRAEQHAAAPDRRLFAS